MTKIIFEKFKLTPVKILSFLPPLFGVLIFSYLIKFSGFESVNTRLPIFQGITAYFSLILIGFTYMKQREAVGGIKVILPLLLIAVIPIILYYKLTTESLFLISEISLIVYFNSISLYLMMIKKNKIRYVIFTIVNSIFQPLTLIYNDYLFAVMIALSLIFLIFNYNQVKSDLEVFRYTTSGVNILKSIFLHGPFIALPLFDYKVQSLLGIERYGDYIFMNKYINGFITLLFSYKQLDLLFDGHLKHKKQIFYLLLVILGILFINSFSSGYMVFLAISLVFYSLGVNLSSLLVRYELLKGFKFNISVIGVLFVGFYIAFLYLFSSKIEAYKNSLYFIMGICTIVPSIILLINNSKNKIV